MLMVNTRHLPSQSTRDISRCCDHISMKHFSEEWSKAPSKYYRNPKVKMNLEREVVSDPKISSRQASLPPHVSPFDCCPVDPGHWIHHNVRTHWSVFSQRSLKWGSLILKHFHIQDEHKWQVIISSSSILPRPGCRPGRLRRPWYGSPRHHQPRRSSRRCLHWPPRPSP